MKQMMITALLSIVGLSAHADGFTCRSESGLNVKVYHHTDANKGTRTAAVMIVSDSTVGAGNKTIATFPAEKGVLKSSQLVYTADVDLRMTGSRRAGEYIGGTRLGELDQIILAVDFTYVSPLAHGDAVTGRLTLLKRDGEKLRESVNCTRYLKN